MRRITKVRRSVRAISPVIATLLMIAIAVVASLVVYAWVTGYIGGTTSTAGKAIQIQSYARQGGDLLIYVQNVGQADVELRTGSSVYVDGDLATITASSIDMSTKKISLPMGQTVELTVPLPAGYNSGDTVNIKVTTTGGTFMTASGKPDTSNGGGPVVQYTLTVTGPFHGSVTKTPDQAQYNSGSSVTLNAIADSGYSFQSWTGDLSGSANPETITVDADKTVTANFVLSPETLMVNKAGLGFGSVTPDVPPPYQYGAMVQLTAAPDVGSNFGGWSGAGTTGADPLVRAVTLTADMSVTATFDITTRIITPSAGQHGTINPNTVQNVNYGSDSPTFHIAADPNYHILDVTDGATSLGGSGLTTFDYQFTVVQANHNIAATFAADVGPLDHFIFSSISSPQNAGIAIAGVTITAVDINDITVTDYSGSTILTETDGGAGGTVTQSPLTFANGVWSGSLTLTKSGAGVTITASGGGKTGPSNTFTVNAGAAATLTVSGFPSPVAAGTAGSVTVTAKDAYGNTATGYRGTVHFISSDAGSPTLPANYAFTAGDNGVHVFASGVTLKTVGTRSITATDTVTGSITGSQTSINVNPGANYQLVFTVAPTTVAHNVVSTVFTIQSQDQFGNPTTTGVSTINIASTSGGNGAQTFYSNSGGTNQITQTSISAGSSTVSFYFKDTTTNNLPRTRTITVSATGLISDTTNISVT